MPLSHDDLLKVIHDTHAVSIWNRDKGPVFWYAANVPGPFYVNTEKVIGAALSEKMLREITAIVAGTVDNETRAKQLNKAIMDAYNAAPAWQALVTTMVNRAHDHFAPGSVAAISGGERRDWLFSIPFAQVAGLPHLFLFKNKSVWCAKPLAAGAKVLHVSDLINNAASYFDTWEPALSAAHLVCAGNVCVNVRGDNGLKRLHDAGQKVVSLMTINLDYFRGLEKAGLVDSATLEEIAIFFASSKDWAIKYLIERPHLFDVKCCDSKSFERLKFFVGNDPWKLRPQHEAFFAAMQQAIDQRMAAAA
jgi:hypothetical protein